MHFGVLAIIVILLGFSTAKAQTIGVYDERSAQNLVWESKLEKQVKFYCDSLMEGRATGTRGGTEAAFALVRKFCSSGLLPLGDGFVHCFATEDSTRVGHNVIGMLPGSKKGLADSYIIVGTHYDNLGKLDGKIYPGADSNASGIVAMTSLSEMFSSMRTLGKVYGSNIIFVAFDAKQLSMAGAYDFYYELSSGTLTDPVSGKRITPDKIKAMVNIDQIGSTLAPLRPGNKEFMIMLGEKSLPQKYRDVLSVCNRFYHTDLELSNSYYGSENFTKLFYTLSNQRPFVEHKIPAVMFTSGITMNTNKTYDTPETLDYGVMRSRIILIYHWIDRVASR